MVGRQSVGAPTQGVADAQDSWLGLSRRFVVAMSMTIVAGGTSGVPASASPGRAETGPVPLLSVHVPRPTGPAAERLESEHGEVGYVSLNSREVLTSLTPALRQGVLGPNRCEDLPASDIDLAVGGEVVRFAGIEASRCNPGGRGTSGYVAWHGQRRSTRGELIGSASLSVLLGTDGEPSLATGTIELADRTIELMPVKDGTYATYEVGDGAGADEHADPPKPGTNEPSEAAGPSVPSLPPSGSTPTTTTTTTTTSTTAGLPQQPGTVAGGDELPGGGGDGQPSEPPEEDLTGVAGDAAQDAAPTAIDGGEPRPGGRAGNRTITVEFAYANGMTATQAYLYMVNRTQQTNDAFINSGMPVRIQASGPVAASYTQTAHVGTDLGSLSDPGDGPLDALLADWQSSGLDALALLVPAANGACGVGKLSTSVERNAPLLSVSAMAAGCDFTVSHELGHNLTAHHNPEDTTTRPAFPWSYGHYVPGKGRTVMSYVGPCADPCPRKLQYSDPDDDLLGFPGTRAGSPYRDNDRSITDSSWAASQAGDASSNDFIWYGSSAGHSSYQVASTTGADMEAPFTPIAGDFNGDGRDDQFWYFPGRPVDRLWTFGAAPGSHSTTAKDVQGAYRPVAGDFDGDGKDDIFWHAPGSAADQIWWGDASATDFGSTTSAPAVSGTYSPQSADLNGDGRDEIVWYAPGTAPDFVWPGNSNRDAFASGAGGLSLSVNGLYHLQASDVDGDQLDDLVWYGPGTIADFVWSGRSDLTTVGPAHQASFTQGGSLIPRAGDFNRDGRGDIFWYGPGSEPDSIWWGQSTLSGFTSPVAASQSVSGVYEPTSGDFDGDGFSDLFWFAFG